MINRRIKYDEAYIDDEEETVTFYYVAPKEFLLGDYPEAVSAEISVEFPTNHIEARYADVSISPIKVESDGGLSYYDWYDISLPYEEIEELISLAKARCCLV